MIGDDKVAEIRERVDLLALVQEYVPLKRVGQSYRGLCPFHSEKSPSFYVHPARGFFHCFGCQASGDAISFVMRLEGRTFPETLRQLAERAGVELPKEDAQTDAREQRVKAKRDALHGLMDAAAGYYVRQLREHSLASYARDELARRGVTDDSAETFRLGYAPHGWDGLMRHLAEHGWSTADAEEVGLLVPRKQREDGGGRGPGHYDRFRHRLMFPVADSQGRVVAFSGRALEPLPSDREASGEGSAKYVNSPEGPLYKKGEMLFGLYEARVAVRREGWAILCEGNFDLLALHQHGFQNAVAPLGTAFTIAQAKLLRRYAERIVLLFDGDGAGKKAVRAAFPLLREAGFSARVVVLPPGDDPDSFLRQRGADALRALIDAAPGIVEHLIDDTASGVAGDARAKAEAISSLGPIVATADNPVEGRLYVERVAKRFEISDVQSVRDQLARGARAARGRPPTQRSAGGGEVDPSAGGGREPHRAPEPEAPVILPELECELLGAFIDVPELFGSEEGARFEELLTSTDLRSIFRATSSHWETSGKVDGAALLGDIGEGPARRWLEGRMCVVKHDDRDAAVRTLKYGLPQLAKRQIESQLPALAKQIADAHRLGDHDRAEELTRQKMTLFRSAKNVLETFKR